MRLTNSIYSATSGAAPDRDATSRQLALLLSHSAFRKSARCSKLLRYLVEQSLCDPDFHPKERTLAVEVFGRRPEFDSGADPIVRTTANEIRKRLGSYYHETGPAEVFIELPAGSYLPMFRMAAPPSEAVQPESLALKRSTGLGLRFLGPHRHVIVACLVVAIAVTTGGTLMLRH